MKSLKMTTTEAILVLRRQLTKHPYSFWAKKFETKIHVPSEQPMSGTLCGSSAALLGNNYAPDKQNYPLCTQCVKAAIKSNHKLLNNYFNEDKS
jgi:hypothetical protein